MLHSPPHLKAAFATNSLTWVDADFARARHLVFYDVTPDSARFLDVLEFRVPAPGGAAPPPGCPGPAELPALGNSIETKLAGLDGSGVLFVTGLSDRSAMRIADGGTYPVVTECRRTVDEVIARLQALMRRDPPLWMCRVLHYGALPPSSPLAGSSLHDRL
jgi:nitrogen fixation protein NifX